MEKTAKTRTLKKKKKTEELNREIFKLEFTSMHILSEKKTSPRKKIPRKRAKEIPRKRAKEMPKRVLDFSETKNSENKGTNGED